MPAQSLTDQLRQLEEEIVSHDNSATKGPLRADGVFTCQRSINDAKDVHYSVFEPDCGNLAHFFKKADAEFYAFARTALLELLAVAKGLEKALECEVSERDYLREELAECNKYTSAELQSLRAENEELKAQLEIRTPVLRANLRKVESERDSLRDEIVAIRNEAGRIENIAAIRLADIAALRAENEQGIKERVMLMHALMGINALPHSAEIDAIMDKALDSIEALASLSQ